MDGPSTLDSVEMGGPGTLSEEVGEPVSVPDALPPDLSYEAVGSPVYTMECMNPRGLRERIVRYVRRVVRDDDDIMTETVHVASLKKAFLEFLASIFSQEMLYDLSCNGLFFGMPIHGGFVGHVMFLSDSIGNYSLVYYVLPELGSNSGSVQFVTKFDEFAGFLLEKVGCDTQARSLIDNLMVTMKYDTKDDVEFRDELKRFKGAQTDVFFTRDFRPDISSVGDGSSLHPYSSVVDEVIKNLAGLYTTFHVNAFNALNGSGSESVLQTNLPLKGKERMRLCYRLWRLTQSRLASLDQKLINEGGASLRIIDVYDIRRVINYVCKHKKTLELFTFESAKKFISDVDALVTKFFGLCESCLLFQSCGKLWAPKTRSDRLSRRKARKRARTGSSDGSDEDAVDASEYSVADNFQDEEDESHVQAMLVSEFGIFLGDLMDRTVSYLRSHLKQKYIDSQKMPREEAETIIILAKTCNTISAKCSTYGSSIAAYKFIPDFLIELIPGDRQMKSLKNHVSFCFEKIQDSIWHSPTDRRYTHSERFELFCLYSEEVCKPPIMPSMYALRQACVKIMSFLGKNVGKPNPNRVVVDAIEYVNQGMLSKVAEGMVRSKSKRFDARNSAGSFKPNMPPGVHDGECKEAKEGAKRDKAFAAETKKSKATGSIMSFGIDAEKAVVEEGSKRRKNAVSRYSHHGLTMKRRAQVGFEIPSLGAFIQRARHLHAESGQDMVVGDGAAKGATNVQEKNMQVDIRGTSFICPDHLAVHQTFANDMYNLRYARCTLVKLCVDLEGFLGRDMFEVYYAGNDDDIDDDRNTGIIYVEAPLLMEESDDGEFPTKRVGMTKKDNGYIFIFNVNNVERNRSTAARQKQTDVQRADVEFSVEIPSLQMESTVDTPFSSLGASSAGACTRRSSRGERKAERDRASGVGTSTDPAVSDTESLDLETVSSRRPMCVSRFADGRSFASVSKYLTTFTADNLLECSKYFVGRMIDGGERLIIKSADILYEEYVGNASKEAARAVHAEGAGGDGGAASSESEVEDCGGDKDQVVDSDFECSQGSDDDRTGGARQPRQRARDTVVANTWGSYAQMCQIAGNYKYDIVNSIHSVCAIVNTQANVCLVLPLGPITVSAQICVFSFLRRCSHSDRRIMGPYHIQYREKNFVESLYPKMITRLLSDAFDPCQFGVYNLVTSQGSAQLIYTETRFDRYLEQNICNFHSNEMKFRTLFQLCPHNGAQGDPLVHSTCYFQSHAKETDRILHLDIRRLQDILNLESRSQGIFLTNATVVGVRCPGCRCLFHPICDRDYKIYLLCNNDPVLQCLKPGVDAFTYAMEMVNGKPVALSIAATETSEVDEGSD